MRTFSCAWLLPITWQDGDHTIRSAISENPNVVCKLNGSVCYGSELLPIEVLHCGNRDFRPFCLCDLDVYPMTFIYELNTHPMEKYRMCENELPT